MIQIRCDACEKVFEVTDDQVGMKVACPYCGDVNRVAMSDGGRGEPVTPAAASTGPGAKEVEAGAGTGAEQVMAVVREGMFRAHPFWYSLIVLLFIGGVVLAAAGNAIAPFAFVAGLIISGGALVWWFVWWIAPHRWRKLTITNRRTILQEGIVMRTTTEVLHKQVTNVRIVQTVLDRLLSVGSIAIDTPGGFQTKVGTKEKPGQPPPDRNAKGRPRRETEDVFVNAEIYMAKIPHPYRVKELIDKCRMG